MITKIKILNYTIDQQLLVGTNMAAHSVYHTVVVGCKQMHNDLLSPRHRSGEAITNRRSRFQIFNGITSKPNWKNTKRVVGYSGYTI